MSAIYKTNSIDPKAGLFLEPMGNYRITTAYWRIIIYLDLEPVFQNHRQLQLNFLDLKSICKSVKNHVPTDHCSLTVKMLNNSLTEIWIKHKELSQIFLHNRKKRSLFDAGGFILKKAFGVMDEEDSQLIESKLNDIAESNQNLQHITEKQLSILKNTIDSFQNITHLVEKNKVIINDLIPEINNLSILQRILHEFDESSTILSLAIQAASNIQSTILNSLVLAMDNKIDMTIINPHTIINSLEKIQLLIKDIQIPTEISMNNFFTILKCLDIELKSTNNKLIFELRMPLVQNKIYKINRVFPIPLLHDNNTYFYINFEQKYVAIDSERSYFIALSYSDFSQCKQITNLNLKTYLCQANLPIKNTNTCLAKTILQEYDKTLCDIRIFNLKNELWFKLEEPNKWIYITPKPIKVKIICGTNFQIETIDNNGLLQLSDDCTVESKNIKLITVQLNTKSLPMDDIKFNFVQINTSLEINFTNQIKLPIVEESLIDPKYKLHYLSKSIQDVEFDIQKHKDNHNSKIQNQKVILFSSSTLISIIIIALLIYFAKKYIKITCTKISKQHDLERENNIEEK